jgi:5'-nucleotidase
MEALNMSLFLSADRDSVAAAVAQGLPAGWVLGPARDDDPDDQELRIAFDFDGVIIDDAPERVFDQRSLAGFLEHEALLADEPHNPGPLKRFLAELCRIQAREEELAQAHPEYQRRLRTSLITARSAPSHERAVMTLQSWGLTVNDAFFLGGIDKGAITSVLRPHIFFDDQTRHVLSTADSAPSVHIPFGIRNKV